MASLLFMSLTARHLLELRKAEGKGKRLSKFPGFYSSNTMTIRGRYGRAYIEEGNEGRAKRQAGRQGAFHF